MKLNENSLISERSPGQCLKTYIQLLCICTFFLLSGQKPQKGLKHPSRDQTPLSAIAVFVFSDFWETLASGAKFSCQNKTRSSWGVPMKSLLRC